MGEFTEQQKERLRQLSDKYRKLRARCSSYCPTWNSEDKDCEIFGWNHPSPSKCPHFLQSELADEEKEKNA